MSVHTSRAHREARDEKINVSSGPSKEIAGLKKKMMMMMMIMMMMKMMTPGLQDSRVWEFSHQAIKVRRGPLGLSVGTYGPLECLEWSCYMQICTQTYAKAPAFTLLLLLLLLFHTPV